MSLVAACIWAVRSRRRRRRRVGRRDDLASLRPRAWVGWDLREFFEFFKDSSPWNRRARTEPLPGRVRGPPLFRYGASVGVRTDGTRCFSLVSGLVARSSGHFSLRYLDGSDAQSRGMSGNRTSRASLGPLGWGPNGFTRNPLKNDRGRVEDDDVVDRDGGGGFRRGGGRSGLSARGRTTSRS